MQNALKIIQDATEIIFYDDELLAMPEAPAGDVLVNRAQTGKSFVNALTYNYLEFTLAVRHVRGDTFSRVLELKALKGEFNLYPYLLYKNDFSVKAIMIPGRLTERKVFAEPEWGVVTSIFLRESTK